MGISERYCDLKLSLKMGSLSISSPAFKFGETIPRKYTSDGENVSPPLQWSGTPSETKELVLIMHDPDAPLPRGFTHWVVYGIPPGTTNLPEGAGNKGTYVEGRNGAGRQGYIGPAPPQGHGPHHYYFWLYALNAKTEGRPGMTREELLPAIENKVALQARLIGIYQR